MQGTSKNYKLSVSRKLRDALKKDSEHERIVFIDPNIPDYSSSKCKSNWMDVAIEIIEGSEAQIKINKKPAPPAYIYVINLPYHHVPDADDFKVGAICVGFKVPDFVFGRHQTIRNLILSREKYNDLYELFLSLNNQSVPSTFDGSPPEFAYYHSGKPRLIIGERYEVPD